MQSDSGTPFPKSASGNNQPQQMCLFPSAPCSQHLPGSEWTLLYSNDCIIREKYLYLLCFYSSKNIFHASGDKSVSHLLTEILLIPVTQEVFHKPCHTETLTTRQGRYMRQIIVFGSLQ